MPKAHSHPSLFGLLFLPFGVISGFTNVTLAFLFTRAGIPLEITATLVAIGLIPNIAKFLWAPLIDTTLTVKKWYILSNIITGAGIILSTVFVIDLKHAMLLIVINFIANVGNTFLAMSTESLMAYDTPEDKKGRAGGWVQAGNLGGMGLGGGVGLWMAQRIPDLWITGVVIAGICLICTFGLLFLSEPRYEIRETNYWHTIRNLNRDIWNTVKIKKGFLGLLLCFLPIGTSAASNMWSAVASDWKASGDAVALVVGVVGGLFSVVGCLAAGWVSDRMDRKRAYILYGVIQALVAVGMAFSPYTEKMFIIYSLVYAITSGFTYAGFSAFTLEAIGKGAAATKYNIFASLSNAPIYYMIYVEEWAHGKWGVMGMLNIEAIMALVGIITFITIFVSVNKMKPAVEIQPELPV
jgi:PAT family beta-lactamase induction signal transducer AmpG